MPQLLIVKTRRKNRPKLVFSENPKNPEIFISGPFDRNYVQ